jgi:3-mercaptopyruvate sulfurtransferase SseA
MTLPQAMGHEKVSVLDGGLQRYLTELLGEGAERGEPQMTTEVSFSSGCLMELRDCAFGLSLTTWRAEIRLSGARHRQKGRSM